MHAPYLARAPPLLVVEVFLLLAHSDVRVRNVRRAWAQNNMRCVCARALACGCARARVWVRERVCASVPGCPSKTSADCSSLSLERRPFANESDVSTYEPVPAYARSRLRPFPLTPVPTYARSHFARPHFRPFPLTPVPACAGPVP